MRRARWLGLAALGLLGAWLVGPSLAGVALAMIDGARGQRTIKRYGELPPGGNAFARLLRDRYGVEVEEAGCNVSDIQIRYIEAYNWYAEPRLHARFGRDVAAECQREAALYGWPAAPSAPPQSAAQPVVDLGVLRHRCLVLHEKSACCALADPLGGNLPYACCQEPASTECQYPDRRKPQ